jgi:hypothetical protein
VPYDDLLGNNRVASKLQNTSRSAAIGVPGQKLYRPATRSGRSLSDPDERALSTPPRDHSGQGFSRLPPKQTRGDSADLPALNPNSPRDESALPPLRRRAGATRIHFFSVFIRLRRDLPSSDYGTAGESPWQAIARCQKGVQAALSDTATD